MNKTELKYTAKALAKQIKEAKTTRNKKYKSASYYMREFVDAEKKISQASLEFWKKESHKAQGVAENLAFEISYHYKPTYRAYMIALGFLRGRKFTEVEKYYYGNNGEVEKNAMRTNDWNSYSLLVDRRTSQEKAILDAYKLLSSGKSHVSKEDFLAWTKI